MSVPFSSFIKDSYSYYQDSSLLREVTVFVRKRFLVTVIVQKLYKQ